MELESDVVDVEKTSRPCAPDLGLFFFLFFFFFPTTSTGKLYDAGVGMMN